MQERGNLSGGERIGSALLGAGLTLLAARRGGPLFRVFSGVVGSSLIGRAFAGHCAMKAAWTGQSSLGQGIADQWQHTSEIGRRVAQRVAETTRRKGGDSGQSSAEPGAAVLGSSTDRTSTAGSPPVY
jgi:hypothetical protein